MTVTCIGSLKAHERGENGDLEKQKLGLDSMILCAVPRILKYLISHQIMPFEGGHFCRGKRPAYKQNSKMSQQRKADAVGEHRKSKTTHKHTFLGRKCVESVVFV